MYDSNKGGSRRHAPALILAMAALTAASGAFAQQTTPPAPAAQDNTQLQEVVVTGSRIAGVNIVATSPTQVITAEDIQTTGKVDITDVISQLPQNLSEGTTVGQDLGNRTSGLTTAGGVATADLRGLGPNRTLVLVDGIRLGIGSPDTHIQSPAPDLDQIPAFLVDRVEVVTGGASATYGSDAVGGVINFIMKKNFEGFQIDGQAGGDWHNNDNTAIQTLVSDFHTTPPTGSIFDGQNRQLDVLMGSNFADNKGNVTAYFSFYDTDPVPGSSRDWDSCQLDEVFDANGDVTGRVCGGSSNSNFFNPETGPGVGTGPYSVYGTNFVPRGSVLTTPPASFNSQPYITLTRGDTRYAAGFLAHDDINDYVKPYADFYFTDDQTHTLVAPGAIFNNENIFDPLGGGYYYTNCSNPLLSAQEAGILCTPGQITADAANPGSQTVAIDLRRRNIEGGPRNSYYNDSDYRAVLGAKGDFLGAWNYDVYGQYYYTNMFESNPGYLNLDSVNNALLVTGTAANPVCISGPPCVPYNIWSQGGVTAAQEQYILLTGTSEGSYSMRTLHAEVTGELGQYGLKIPTANDGVAVNFGFEHRGEQQTYNPDSAEESGLMLGLGGAAASLDASDHVNEGFAELRVPIMEDKEWAKDLVFDTAFRRSNYSLSGSVETHKFELQYAPTTDIRIRASFDKAIRAPALIELFNPQIAAETQLGNDPCATTGPGTVASASLAQCLNSVSAAQRAAFTAAYGNGGSTDIIPQTVAGQGYELAGGNPDLKPEVAKTWSAGFTFTPSFVPGLSGSLDYFHILLDDEVGVASGVLGNCIFNADPGSCALVVRNYANFGLSGPTQATGGYIVQTNENVGVALFSGVDLQLNYKMDLPAGFGALALAVNGSYTEHNGSGVQATGPTTDCAGLYGPSCGDPNPRWKQNLRLSWITPWDVTGAVTWRYIGKVTMDNNDPLFDEYYYGGFNYVNGTIPAYNYIDLAATWHATKNIDLRAGINNIADKDPPLAFGGAGGGYNTYGAYDSLGRQVFAAFTAKF
jgi:iron complex outermembrane receptor protein